MSVPSDDVLIDFDENDVSKAKFLRLVFEGQAKLIEDNLSDGRCPSSEDLSATFLLACRLGKIKVVEVLKDRVAPNVRNLDGMTGLMLAARHDNKDLVRLLLNRDADAQIADMSGRNALHWATIDGKLSNVKVLLDHSCSTINEVDRSGSTPLMYAVQSNKALLVQLLLSKGADPHRPNRLKETPLHMACRFGYNTVIPKLLPHIRHLNLSDQRGHTPFMLACQHNHRVVVSQLLAHQDVDVNAHPPNQPELSPLSLACRNQNPELVELLMSNGARPTSTAVKLAAASCPNNLQTTEISKLANSQDPTSILKELLKSDATFQQYGQSALREACTNACVPTLQYLLEQGVPVKSSPPYLPIVCSISDPESKVRLYALECAKLLLKFGADPTEPLTPNCGVPALIYLISNLGWLKDGCLDALATVVKGLQVIDENIVKKIITPDIALTLANHDIGRAPFGFITMHTFVSLLSAHWASLEVSQEHLHPTQGAYVKLVKAYLRAQLKETNDVNVQVLTRIPDPLVVPALSDHPFIFRLIVEEAGHDFLRYFICCGMDVTATFSDNGVTPIEYFLAYDNLEGAVLLAEAGASLSFLWRCEERNIWPIILAEGRSSSDSLYIRLYSMSKQPRSLRDAARNVIRQHLHTDYPRFCKADWLKLPLDVPDSVKLHLSVAYDPNFVRLYNLILDTEGE